MRGRRGDCVERGVRRRCPALTSSESLVDVVVQAEHAGMREQRHRRPGAHPVTGLLELAHARPRTSRATASGNVDPNTDASASEPSVAGVQR